MNSELDTVDRVYKALTATERELKLEGDLQKTRDFYTSVLQQVSYIIDPMLSSLQYCNTYDNDNPFSKMKQKLEQIRNITSNRYYQP